MERHIQSIVQALILAALLFFGRTLLEVKDSALETKTSLDAMKAQIADINTRFDRYPTRDEVNARFETAESARKDMGHRLDALEGRRARQDQP